MKKRFLGLIVIIALVLSTVVGCSKDISTQYHDAVEKTAKVNKLSQTIEFALKIDTSGLNISAEEQMAFQLYNDIKGTINVKSDIEGKLAEFDGTVNAGGIGFSAKGFYKDEKLVVQIPMMPQYIVMDIKELQALSGQTAAPDTTKLQESFKGKFSSLWEETVTKDKIKKLGDESKNIGDSVVKTTEFEFSLTNEEINKLITSIVDLVVKDAEFKKLMITTMNQQNPDAPITEAEFDTQMNEVLPQLEAALKDIKVENFKFTGNIDKDSYLIQETVSFDVNANIPDAGAAKLGLSYTIKRSDIGKDVTVEMPVLDESNSINFMDLMGEMSGVPTGF